jgi:ATP-binding cassette subfamily B protein
MKLKLGGLTMANNSKSRIDLYKQSTYRKRNDKPKNAMKTSFRLIKYLNTEIRLLSVVIILIIGSILLTLAATKVYQVILDDYLNQGILKGFLKIILFLATLYLLENITNYLSSFMMIGISQRTLAKMRRNMFAKMQQLSVSFFDKNRDGDLMTRITNDVDNISNTMTQTVVHIISSVVMLIGTLGLMAKMNLLLTGIALIFIFPIVLSARLVAKVSRKQFRKMRYEQGALNGYVAEQINGAKVIQSFCQEDEIIREFILESNNVKNTTIKALTIANFMDPVMGFLNNIRYIGIITTGAAMVVLGYTNPESFYVKFGLITPGIIIVFIELANKFGSRINSLANLYTDIQNALSSAERIFDILDDTSEIKNSPNAEILENVFGKVDFNNVSFSYNPGTPILNNVTIHAKPNMKIAIVGHTGAGKSTIINLLTRFYEINEGQILIDNKDIRDVTKESLAEHVGIVLQDTNLFSDTIYNNIRYGKLNATEDEIINACKLANCHDFITSIPNGYQTMLTRNGSNLSHGQRQLLSIARTMLKNPDILILDEATSSVDTITEKQIQNALNNLTQNKTTFVIAHRLSTIRNSDLIIVMDQGEIKEQGTHEELLKRKGKYYNLHNSIDTKTSDHDLAIA